MGAATSGSQCDFGHDAQWGQRGSLEFRSAAVTLSVSELPAVEYTSQVHLIPLVPLKVLFPSQTENIVQEFAIRDV